MEGERLAGEMGEEDGEEGEEGRVSGEKVTARSGGGRWFVEVVMYM